MATSERDSRQNADTEDAPFQHYSLKNRIVSWISRNLFDRLTYRVGNGPLKGMMRRGGLGWLPSWVVPEEFTAEKQFLSDLKLDGKIVYDIGAFHGLLTLYFATRAAQVVSFEPSTPNYRRLSENISLNNLTNVVIHNVGVGSKTESRRLVGSILTPGGATLDSGMSTHLPDRHTRPNTEEIKLIAVDDGIREGRLPVPDFIKVDIEGWELEALRGAQETLRVHAPALFLEMHGETIRQKKKKVAEIVNFLWDLDYRNIVHIEGQERITPDNSELAIRGHLYCRRD